MSAKLCRVNALQILFLSGINCVVNPSFGAFTCWCEALGCLYLVRKHARDGGGRSNHKQKSLNLEALFTRFRGSVMSVKQTTE